MVLLNGAKKIGPGYGFCIGIKEKAQSETANLILWKINPEKPITTNKYFNKIFIQ